MQHLVNLLLRNKDVTDDQARGRAGIIGGVLGIIVNALIFTMEIIVGTVVNSVTITADAFHNLTDVVSSVITIISFRVAGKPADKKHPFGHGRVEYLSALIVAMIIMIIGFEFVQTSFEKILHPSPVRFDWLPFILMLSAIPLKLILSRFNSALGRKIGSSTLEASSFDALSDVLVLSVASLSLIISNFTNANIDGYLGLVVALFIMYSGFSIARKELSPLLGEAPDPALVKQIIQGVMEAKYVSGVHDLIIHNYGPGKYMATIHAEVPCDMPIMDIHEEIDHIEQSLSEKLGILLVIHMDPLNNSDEVVKDAKQLVLEVIRDFPGAVSIHDVRVVGHGNYKKLIFDVVADDSIVSKQDVQRLHDEIATAIKQRNGQYDTVINIDRNYTV